MVNNQGYLFIIFTLDGALIGMLFDFFRVLRKSFKTKDFMTYIEDICFWIIAGIIILYSMCVFCDGELRFFMILGLIIGVSIYILTLSKYIMKISVVILNVLKKILGFPFKIIYKVTNKIIFRPIFTIFSKIRNKTVKSSNKVYNKIKKFNKKRGFFVKKEKYNNI